MLDSRVQYAVLYNSVGGGGESEKIHRQVWVERPVRGYLSLLLRTSLWIEPALFYSDLAGVVSD